MNETNILFSIGVVVCTIGLLIFSPCIISKIHGNQ